MLGVILLLSIFLIKLYDTSSDKSIEIDRLKNNAIAATDSIHKYITEEGNIAASIAAYKLDIKKDKDLIESMTADYAKLKGKLIAIVSGSATIVETKVEVPVYVNQLTDSTGIIKINDSIVYNVSNYTKLQMTAPISVIDKKLVVGKAKYEINTSMDLLIRFQQNKESLIAIVETPNKGVSFASLKGGVVTGNDLPKDMKIAMRREWGLGVSANIGLGYDVIKQNIMPVITIGMGINYTPKKLQLF